MSYSVIDGLVNLFQWFSAKYLHYYITEQRFAVFDDCVLTLGLLTVNTCSLMSSTTDLIDISFVVP